MCTIVHVYVHNTIQSIIVNTHTHVSMSPLMSASLVCVFVSEVVGGERAKVDMIRPNMTHKFNHQ